jgi:putative addiction module component (TIGR02574 family)
MSKAEILEELARLTPEERREVVAKARELEGDQWIDPDLTEDEKRLLDAELEEYKKHPDAGSTWDEMENRIRQSPKW